MVYFHIFKIHINIHYILLRTLTLHRHKNKQYKIEVIANKIALTVEVNRSVSCTNSFLKFTLFFTYHSEDSYFEVIQIDTCM
jgi:hypothetical protein